NGNSYTFQVRACNANGCNQTFSQSSNSPRLCGVPGQPNVTGSVNGTTLNWSWSTPTANGCALTRFDVRLDGNLVTPQSLNSSYSQSFAWSEQHTLSVQAVNSKGPGPAGSLQQTTALPPKPTATNLVVAPHGGGNVGVAFDVSWVGGQDPITCHFIIDGSEQFT